MTTNPTPTLADTLAAAPTVSQAITNYVNKAGRCSWFELFGIFGHEDDTEGHRKEFSLILSHLVQRGHIRGRHRGGVGSHLADRYYTRPEDPAAIAKTPPPQYNAMTAPVYAPPACSVLRPGALDYQRYATRGVRC